MDIILCHANIKTMDPACPSAQALAIRDHKIAALGSDDEVLALKTDRTRVIDLGGAFLLPGFIDSHMHMMDTAFLRTKLDLGACKSFAEVKALVCREADRIRALNAREPGKVRWINGVNFNQNNWQDTHAIPTRLDLDEITGEIPCYLLRVCGHIACHNTAGMAAMGLMSERPGTLRKMTFFEDGTPTGQLFESDADPAEQFTDKPQLEDYKRWIREETARYACLGLVAIHSDDLNIVDPGHDALLVMQAFKECAEAGDMTIRVYEQCRIEDSKQIRTFAAAWPWGTVFGSDAKFKTVSFKQMMDGSLGAHSANMRHGYLNDPQAKGIAVHTDDEIRALVRAASECGYPVVAHSIGDAAVDQLLNAFDDAEAVTGKRLRNGVVHCQIMGFDQLERMAHKDILAYVQPVFIGTDAAIVEDCVGPEIAAQSYNWRRMADLGIHISGGSDCPVESNDPINNIYYAVTRDGGHGQAWYPQGGLTIEEALRAFTIEGAYAAGEEDRRGSLTVGKYADIVVLDRDLTAIDPRTIRETKVLMTMVDGEIVYFSCSLNS